MADVDRIAAQADPLVRNLQITQCYHELSSGFAALTGATANWCTFATWASKQAGQTIRREDLARTFEDLFGLSPEALEAGNSVVAAVADLSLRGGPEGVWDMTWEALHPTAAFDRASEAVGRGNKKVFEEIGREFARLLEASRGGPIDREAIERFCAELRPGDPPDGQRYLRQAFTHFQQTLVEDDPKAKSELMLLANLEIGFHEQTRLQPDITEALNAPLPTSRSLKRRLLVGLFPHRPSLFLRTLLASLRGRRTSLDNAVAHLAEQIRELSHRAITECLMTLALAEGEVLKLGRDVPADFPERLERIANADLRRLHDQIDPTPDTPRGSGAEVWASLPDRMHFIADLFRAYQERQGLFSPPFTPEQVRVIKAGGRPAGRL
ncbi:MAG TPA: hypothetical protein VGV40_13285 [Solirubrobacteraceae bacterium]|nr:hypothetical protein [Solirubrobacteraceae bacterium]